MAEYIDREKLCKNLIVMAKLQEPYKQSTILGVVETIVNTRSADVAEVRHGKWQKQGNEKKCSLCEFIYYSNNDDFNFCPNCGAKMYGERKEQK